MMQASDRAIPTVKGLPVLGSALGLTGDLNAFLLEHYRALGPVFRVKVPGRAFTVMAGLEANHFMTREGANFRSKEFWKANVAVYGASRALIDMDGPEHARFRKVQKRGYARSTLEGRVTDVSDLTRAELERQQGAVGVHYLLQRVVSRQLGLLTAGTTADEYLDDITEFVRTTIAATVNKRLPAFMLKKPSYQRAKARTFELGRAIIERHSAGEHDDLISDILTLHRQDPDFLPERDLLIGVLGPFTAGLDTAASTLAFALYNLYRYPEVLAQVQAEADTFFTGDRTLARLKDMSVTYRLVLETLRLYPIAPALNRTTTQAFEFAGYKIPAGETVLIATTLPHFLDEHFPAPHSFDLGRYLPPRQEHRQTGAFAPYGLGAHTCLGTGLAEALMLLNLAILTHFFELRFSPADYKLRVDRVPTPKPSKAFKLELLPRQS